MVTCSQVVDGGRWKGELAEQAMKSSRPLVYDVETGSLRFSKSRAPLTSPPASFNIVGDEEHTLRAGNPAQHKRLLGKVHCGGGSGESSPTCVIQNSALRSNSSSPTMSTVSKASSDHPGRKSRDRSHSAGTTKSPTVASSPEYDEELIAGASPASEPQTIGDGLGRKKHGVNTARRTELKGPPVRRIENDAKENGWAIPRGEVVPEEGSAQTPPFKSIQCAAADKTREAAAKQKKSNHGGMIMASQPASIMHKSPGLFSFNATYMARADCDDLDGFITEPTDLSRRTTAFLTPLLKPTPSKWDDAEKWVPGSNPPRAKSRSGPLLAQMVAAQAGMSGPWRAQTLLGQPRPRIELAEETPSDIATKLVVPDFTSDEKLLLETSTDGSVSPSCMNGSFMNLGKTRDMGTAMTPIPSVEPSRTGTPVRAAAAPDDDHAAASGASRADDQSTPRTLTEEELQEKTRQEIVALGTQLGKASIAAAWAARDAVRQPAVDLENLRSSDVCASKADAWKEAEQAKYTSRYQQEEAKITAWEEHEKAKAEAEMLRVEAKVERMKAQAQEKLAQKLAATRRQAEELRLVAEARRNEAAAKAARKAQLMKTHGKITSFFFLSFLCT